MRFLFDTNVFLDYLLQRENYKKVEELLFRCFGQKHEIYATTMTIRDIGYLSHKHFHDKKETSLAIQGSYELCTKIVPVNVDALIETLYENYSDFEDGLMIEAANESMCDARITRDKKGFKQSDIPVYSLEEINNRLAKLNRAVID